MATATCQLIGVGLYTVPEAARLTRVPAPRIRRWVAGYKYKPETAQKYRFSPPVLAPDFGPVNGTRILSFLDLQEMRFVDAFRRRGVSSKTLRRAHERARDHLRTGHPFSTGRFRTDGHAILLDLAHETHDQALQDIVKDQLAFRKIIEPFLLELDLEADQAVRWWPLGKRRHVLLDPQRHFGQPIVREGVPTAILARAYAVERSRKKLVKWFDVKERSVRDAVAFEQRLAA